MSNKFAGYGLAKIVMMFPLLIFAFYEYTKFKDILFLIVALAYLLLVLLDLYITKGKNNTSSSSSNNRADKDLRERISRQNNELEGLIASTDELAVIRNELILKDEELKALRDASQMITATFDVKNTIEYLYDVFNRFTGCDRYLICFPEKDASELVCKYEFGSVTFDKVGDTFEEDTIIGKCFKEGKTVISSNDWIKTRGINGDRIAIPLNVSGEGLGVVYIESGVIGTFTNINVGFFESLSAYVAIAIKNAELFNNIYLQKQEIEALYEQTAAVNEELNSYIEELNKTKEELRAKNDELTKFYDEIQTGYLQTVMALANSIEAKDPYTRGHCQRVMEIACEIAKVMGYRDEEVDDLRYAAILHDIGKIGISASILNKAGKLTEEEFNEIKKHPQIAYNILKDVVFIKDGLEGILQHHERYDGKGYPYGKRGDEICKFGRILCIADAFDAMTSDRPYRKGMSMEEAIKEVERCKGAQFDPEIADAFINMSRGIIESNNGIEYQTAK